MLVDPIVVTPTNWMIFQNDQHRRDIPTTSGISGKQSQQNWLSLLKAVVQNIRSNFPRFCVPPVPAPLLSAVKWIFVRLSLYDKSNQYPPLALVGVS